MSRVGFKPMIPVFERTKKVHAFDRAATVTGPSASYPLQIPRGLSWDQIRVSALRRQRLSAWDMSRNYLFYSPLDGGTVTR
jgi:hypothetical protein